MTDTQFKYLFTPLKIGSITIKNRIFQSGITQNYEELVDDYALTNERSACYYAERAKGGAGLLIMGYQMVHPTSTGGIHRTPVAYRKEVIPRYKMAAEKVHEHGGTLFGQIAHTGILADGEIIDDFLDFAGNRVVFLRILYSFVNPLGFAVGCYLEKREVFWLP